MKIKYIAYVLTFSGIALGCSSVESPVVEPPITDTSAEVQQQTVSDNSDAVPNPVVQNQEPEATPVFEQIEPEEPSEVEVLDEEVMPDTETVDDEPQQMREDEVLSEVETEAYIAKQETAQAAQEERQQTREEEPVAFTTVGTGTFTGASGKSAEGSFMIEEKGDEIMITLSDDFQVGNGPDLYLAFTQNQPLSGEKVVSLDPSKVKIIEALASTKGKQFYTISKSEFEQYNYGITIWCQNYNVLFGSSVIQ